MISDIYNRMRHILYTCFELWCTVVICLSIINLSVKSLQSITFHSSRRFTVNLLDGRRLDGIYPSQLRLRDNITHLDPDAQTSRADPPYIEPVDHDVGILIHHHELSQAVSIEERSFDGSSGIVCDQDSYLSAVESAEPDEKI